MLELLTHNNFKSEVRIGLIILIQGYIVNIQTDWNNLEDMHLQMLFQQFPYFYNSFYKDGKSILLNINQQLDFGYWMNSNWKGVIYPFKEPNEVDLFLL